MSLALFLASVEGDASPAAKLVGLLDANLEVQAEVFVRLQEKFKMSKHRDSWKALNSYVHKHYGVNIPKPWSKWADYPLVQKYFKALLVKNQEGFVGLPDYVTNQRVPQRIKESTGTQRKAGRDAKWSVDFKAFFGVLEAIMDERVPKVGGKRARE